MPDLREQFAMIPAVLRLAAWQHRRATGQQLDMRRAFWTPPLAPAEVLRTEALQIQKLGLPAMVSLTDHDSVDAGLSLQPGAVPVSIEWTVPFGCTFFHLGVHNLPPLDARRIAKEMKEYTARPAAPRLAGLLESLHAQPGVLTVLNHPMWDVGGVGVFRLAQTLDSMLRLCGRWIHAFELNGLRPWVENRLTLGLAGRWSKPVVSGGDRHGAEPNAAINLTNAGTFDEFAAEVREAFSHVLFLPRYREPLRGRWLRTATDILRFYPDANERRHWTDRFFYRCDDGILRSAAEAWHSHRPRLLNALLALVGVLQWEPLRSLIPLVSGSGRKEWSEIPGRLPGYPRVPNHWVPGPDTSPGGDSRGWLAP